MEFTVRFEEYEFGGVVQRSVLVDGTTITGTAAEQRAGGWAWFLRYPDGESAGEGKCGSWAEVLRDIRRALVMEIKYGRLGFIKGSTAL